MIDLSRYPALVSMRAWRWANGATCDIEYRHGMPPEDLIGNVNVVGFVADRVVVIVSRDWGVMLPGGTLEEGEGWRACLERELAEEAGARMRSCTPFGALRFLAHYTEPYKPWLPHPEFHRLFAHGELEITGVPSNPPGGEHILRVEVLAPEEAARRFRDEKGEGWAADLILLAAEIRAG